MMCLNGKHGGNNCLLNPLGVVNDGAIEILLVKGRVGPSGMMRYMAQSTKEGGTHIYDKDVAIIRGKKFKIVSKQPKNPHVFAIDGEVLYFNETLTYDCEFQGLEVLVDFKDLMDPK